MRLPAHLEVAALVRRTQAEGGFATILHKGETDAGSILVSLVERGGSGRLYERMPQLAGGRAWTLVRSENPEEPQNYAEYVSRRAAQDPDLWIVELDIANGERFIGFSPSED